MVSPRSKSLAPVLAEPPAARSGWLVHGWNDEHTTPGNRVPAKAGA